MPRTAEDFVASLGLDEEDIPDVAEELSTSIEAWTATVAPVAAAIDLLAEADTPLLERLFKKLKL